MNSLALITMITDATSVISALTPLIQQQLSGQRIVNEEDVRQALAGKDAALLRFDVLLAERSIEEDPRAGALAKAPT